MKLVDKSISNSELKDMSEKMHGDMVKAVVDIKQGIMVVDSELHADEEDYLLEQGSKQEDLWGINIYPDKFGTENWIEYDSMINLRPVQNNRSRGVDNPEFRAKIQKIVKKLVEP